MANDRSFPPTRGQPSSPSMAGGSTADLIRNVVGGQSPSPSPLGGGMGDPRQAAQLIAAGAQQLMQAAQMFPPLAEPIQQAIAIIQQSIASMTGGEGGGMGGPQKPSRKRGSSARSRNMDQESGVGSTMGSESGMM